MAITKQEKYGECARCGRRVRLDTLSAMAGQPGHRLWEYADKMYGYECFKIAIGDYPPRNKQVKYYNPKWDDEPLPF